MALAVRAALAQQPPSGAQRGDPYSQQFQPPSYQPSPSVPRYPLPPATYAQPGVQPQPPAVNQTLRYPLPAAGTLPPSPAPAAQVTRSAAPTSGPQQASFAPAAGSPQRVLFAPGQTVARVADKTILYCDVAPTVNLIMAPVLAKAQSEAERESIETQREALTKNVVQQAIQNKMLLTEFERDMPGELRSDAKKRAEAEGKLKKNVRNAFDSTLGACRDRIANASQDDIDKMMRQDPTVVRLALLMKERHLESQGELDAALREFGTSLEQQVKDFGEYMMGMEAARNKIGSGAKAKKKEVTHQEMLDYYQQHLADYNIPAKARFEILTARLARFNTDRQKTWDHAATMGNEVLLGGTPFAAVARKHSHEPHADAGGYYDWVTPGSLASKPIDRAVFSLEVGKLSQIIEDDTGFHIIRIKERKAAGQVSFQEAQPEIKKAIEAQRSAAEQQKYLTNLRARTKVWTIYDEPGQAAN
jgi:hypothetical protein